MTEDTPALPPEAATDAGAALTATARWLVRSTIRNEHQFRALYAYLLEGWLRERRREPADGVPRGARIPHIEQALAPLRPTVSEATLHRLVAAVSVLIGIEGWMVLHDVWGMDADEAEDVLIWAAQTLLAAVTA